MIGGGIAAGLTAARTEGANTARWATTRPTAWSANTSYLIADRQGSIVATGNTAGALTANYTYDPYGVPNSWGTVGTVRRFRYTGSCTSGTGG